MCAASDLRVSRFTSDQRLLCRRASSFACPGVRLQMSCAVMDGVKEGSTALRPGVRKPSSVFELRSRYQLFEPGGSLARSGTMSERQHAVSEIVLDRKQFSSLFVVGEQVASGGPRERANAACLAIKQIEDDGVRVKAIKAKDPVFLKYREIQAVVSGFETVNPRSIQRTIQHLLRPLSASGNETHRQRITDMGLHEKFEIALHGRTFLLYKYPLRRP